VEQLEHQPDGHNSDQEETGVGGDGLPGGPRHDCTRICYACSKKAAAEHDEGWLRPVPPPPAASPGIPRSTAAA